ncbi:MAG: hypothetical protein JKY95_03290 [Planctomycetaceae bacterium]|nr:hypothetical protein [Planctomycetaceae bacterium]
MSNYTPVTAGLLRDLSEENVAQTPSLRVFNGNEPPLTGDDFRSLFQRRHEYSRLLLELSTKQQELIGQGQYNELIELLLKKQTILDALQSLSGTDPPLLEQWKENRETISVALRRECEHWLSLSEQVLAELMDLEQTCTSQLQQKRDATQSQLEAVSNTIHVQDAYSQESFDSQFDRSQ